MIFSFILSLLSILPTIIDSAVLEVSVSNLENSNAPIYFAIYQDDKFFLKTDKMYKGLRVSPKGSTQPKVKISVPAGEYALAVYQDINENGKLDLNFLGIPTEPYGFSQNFKPRLSAPNFSDIKVYVKSKTSIAIKLLD